MRVTCIAAVLSLFAVPVFAGDEVQLKVKANKGDKITRETGFGGSGTLSIEAGEMKQAFDCEMDQQERVVEEVVAVAEDGTVTELKRLYIRNRETFQIPDLGQNNDKISPLVGKVIRIVLKDGASKATAEGVDADDLKKERLDDELERALCPDRPVKQGDTWEADPEKVKKWMQKDEEQEVKEASMSCTFEGVEEKFGHKCGKIRVRLKSKSKGKDDAGNETSISMDVEGPVWFGLEPGRTLGMELKGKMKMSGPLPQGQQGKMKLAIDLTITGSSTWGQANFDESPETSADDEEGGGMDGDEGDEEE